MDKLSKLAVLSQVQISEVTGVFHQTVYSLRFCFSVTSKSLPCATVTLSCLSVTLVYCGQMVGWIKMPLGTEVGLSPGDIVFPV